MIPQFYAARNQRKDAVNKDVLDHITKFYYSISSDIAHNKRRKKEQKRMDMTLKDAYAKWISQVRMPIQNGGLNKPSNFVLSYSVFLKAKPTNVKCMTREYDSETSQRNEWVVNGGVNVGHHVGVNGGVVVNEEWNDSGMAAHMNSVQAGMMNQQVLGGSGSLTGGLTSWDKL